MTRSQATFSSPPARERAVLVGLTVSRTRDEADAHLGELRGLANAAGAMVVATTVQDRARPDPVTLLGSGKVDHLAAMCGDVRADIVVFDNELSPAQLRNLEDRLGRRVIDRTQLILDIFARRAHTREGKLQVERAQLEYMLPRLVGSAAALSRLGGGIGTRGPGETKLETDRRKIRLRLKTLGDALAGVANRRRRLRERRRRMDRPTVALVGYTNAGKTTLFNLLTHAEASASDALFVTLDPLVREIRLPGRQTALLSDTVGFIDRLPHTLVAAFRATLEEVADADLLLHVVDASSPTADQQMEAVLRVLTEVGASEVPRLTVFNKCDRLVSAEARPDGDAEAAQLPGSPLERLERQYPTARFVSARRGEGVTRLTQAIAEALALDTHRISLELDPEQVGDQEVLTGLYRHAHVLHHAASGGRVSIEAEVPRRLVARFRGAISG